MSNGRVESIDEAIVALDAVVRDGVAENHAWTLFAALYREVTLAVRRGIEAGWFEDARRMNKFDAVFASRYLQALELHREGRGRLRSWSVAFAANLRYDVTALQHLLLGVNAHINVDLGLSVAEAGIDPTLFHPDFIRINRILEQLLDGTQAALNIVSPMLSMLDGIVGKSDERLGVFVVERARDAAWTTALLARALPREKWPQLEEMVDLAASQLGLRLASPGLPTSAAVHLVRRHEFWTAEQFVGLVGGLHVKAVG